ncbi:MAG: hypothetical protein LBL61_06110 [Elusimicrobiota bacterium]|jgi:hypothetical protein|nr:hypothetical protein [Elusimicrobiota bacterium]
MFKEKRGSALMQVLVLGGVIAGIVVLLLRFSAARMVNVVKTTRKMQAKAYAEGCMAQFTAAAMMRELHGLPPSTIEEDGTIPTGNDLLLYDYVPGYDKAGYKAVGIDLDGDFGRYRCSYEVGPANSSRKIDPPAAVKFRQVFGGITPDATMIPPTLMEVTIDVPSGDLE